MNFFGYTFNILALQCLGIICIPFVIGIIYNLLFRKNKNEVLK
jgi:hypothetical protein